MKYGSLSAAEVNHAIAVSSVFNHCLAFICVWTELVKPFTYESSVRLGYVATGNDAIEVVVSKYAISLTVPGQTVHPQPKSETKTFLRFPLSLVSDIST